MAEGKPYKFEFDAKPKPKTRASVYKDAIEDFVNSKQKSAKLVWEGNQKPTSIVRGLRQHIASQNAKVSVHAISGEIFLRTAETDNKQ